MADQPQYSAADDNSEFIRRQLNWKIPGIILGLLVLVVSSVGIFTSYYYTGPLRLQYGFINSEGEVIVEPQFDSVEQYENNHAIFRQEGRYGILDQNGEVIFPARFTSIDQQSEELVSGLIEAELRIMRRGGELVDDAFVEIEDLTATPIRVKTQEGWGLLEKDGSYRLEPGFDSLAAFDGRNIAVFEQNDRQGLVNREGTVIMEAEYDELEFVDDELLWIKRDSQYGLARGGEVLLETQYDNREPFTEGLAAVQKDGLWGFVSDEGEVVVEPEFQNVGSFSEGRARIGVLE